MRVKRAGLRGLVISACLGQACFFLDDCGEGPTPLPPRPPNTAPVISGLRVAPPEMLAGGNPAQVSATITDPEGDPVTWSFAVEAASQATGTFSPTGGSGGAVSSQFSPAPTSSGQATLRLFAIDRAGANSHADVTVFVVAPRR
jgi:hypothetical protein